MKNTNLRVHEEHRASASIIHAETKQVVAPMVHVSEKARLLSEKSKLVRRYSFDDNGGSYEGL